MDRIPEPTPLEPPTLAEADLLRSRLDDGEVAAAMLVLARLLRLAAEEQCAEPEPAPAVPPARRRRRPSPGRLAKWEAQWQAEQAAGGGAES